MPWFKVDDKLATHPKAFAAGNAAMGLWVRAGSWSMGALTDGEIPRAIVRTLGTERQAAQLVAAGLWEATAEGWRFHEWSERQPSREKLDAEMAAARERKQRSRDAARARRDSAEVAAQLPRDAADAAPRRNGTRRDSDYPLSDEGVTP